MALAARQQDAALASRLQLHAVEDVVVEHVRETLLEGTPDGAGGQQGTVDGGEGQEGAPLRKRLELEAPAQELDGVVLDADLLDDVEAEPTARLVGRDPRLQVAARVPLAQFFAASLYPCRG